MAYAMNWWIEISTHSLTRRLTETLAKIETFLGNFNSQPHKEADEDRADNGRPLMKFQLTASQGG